MIGVMLCVTGCKHNMQHWDIIDIAYVVEDSVESFYLFHRYLLKLDWLCTSMHTISLFMLWSVVFLRAGV